MRIVLLLAIAFTFLFATCKYEYYDIEENKSDLFTEVIDCNKDSAFFYYSKNMKRYLTLYPYRVSITFYAKPSESDLLELAGRFDELDSAKVFRPHNQAFAYTNRKLSCDEINSLLFKLNMESNIKCANPNFVYMEEMKNGVDMKELFPRAMSDAILVALKENVPAYKLDSLLNETNTTFVDETSTSIRITGDKYAFPNTLEMANYFFETGLFKMASPNFTIKVVSFG